MSSSSLALAPFTCDVSTDIYVIMLRHGKHGMLQLCFMITVPDIYIQHPICYLLILERCNIMSLKRLRDLKPSSTILMQQLFDH
jgi:hypothetical protein